MLQLYLEGQLSQEKWKLSFCEERKNQLKSVGGGELGKEW